MLTFRDPKYYLFFTSAANSRRAAKDFLERLKERKADRDKPITLTAFLRQLKAIKAWGKQAPQDLSVILKPILVANGDQDIMVPSSNSIDLARRLPNAELVLYEDAGHGGIFQYHETFVKKALAFPLLRPFSSSRLCPLVGLGRLTGNRLWIEFELFPHKRRFARRRDCQ